MLTISEAWNLRKKYKYTFSGYFFMFNKLFHATLPVIDFFQHPGSGCNLISCSHVTLATERGAMELTMRMTKHLFLKSNPFFFSWKTHFFKPKRYIFEKKICFRNNSSKFHFEQCSTLGSV